MRTAGGNIYAVIPQQNDTSNLGVQVYESTDGGNTWTQQDAANEPSGDDMAVSAAIDGNGVIHIAYFQLGRKDELRYVSFTTATNTFSGDTSIATTPSTPSTPRTAIAVDSNNVPHILYEDNYGTVGYVDEVGGTWNSTIQIYGDSSSTFGCAGDILIDQNNLPEISYVDCGTSLEVYAAIGNATKATSFTSQGVGTGDNYFGTQAPMIAMDSANDTWVSYVAYNGAVGVPGLAEHVSGHSWSTWSPPALDTESSVNDYFPWGAVGLTVVGMTPYVAYISQGYANYGTIWQSYNGTSWSPIGGLAAFSEMPQLRWSEYFDYDSSQIDVLLVNGGGTSRDEIISSIFTMSPPSGAAGTSVTISGSNFGATQGTSTVTFNGVIASVTDWSDGQIVATVPCVASGPVLVNVGGIPSNQASYSVPPPHVSSLSPSLGTAGTVVTINGSGFPSIVCPNASASFGGIAASITSWTNTQIKTAVPSGAATGPVLVTVESLESDPMMFTVPGALSGNVTDSSNGSAVSGAEVAVLQSGSVIASTSTGIDGSYAIPNLPTGFYDLRFSASGFGTSILTDITVVSGGATTANGSLSAPGTIAGQVTESDGVTPIPGATVSVAQGAEAAGSATTDTNGSYTISTLSPGTYSVVAGATGFTTANAASISVTAGSTTQDNFTLAAQSASTITYAYDELGRVTGVSDSMANTAIYRYDAAGNLLSTAVNPSSEVYIVGFDPSEGLAGDSVTIVGTGFSSMPSQDAVTFNGTTATVTSASTTQLVVAVPTGSTTGPIQVTAPNGSATSDSVFTVAPQVSITSFAPSTGPIGTSVTITGTGFSSTVAQNTVSFSGIAGTVTSASATQIVATVPSGATTGSLTVTTTGGSATSGSAFTVSPSAAISTFSPNIGPVGTIVTITGSGFSPTAGQNTVTFNGTAASVTSATLTQIVTTVPTGASTGPIMITSPNGSATSNSSFTITVPVTISSFSPTAGPVGTSVTITGTGFSGTLSEDTVAFNGVAATISSASTTQIVATVPTGATTGPITVTAPGGSATSSSSFTVRKH